MTGWSSAPFLIRDDQQGNKWPFLIGLPHVPKLNDYNLISPAVCKDSSWLVTLLLILYDCARNKWLCKQDWYKFA